MSIIKGKIESDREIVQRHITVGKSSLRKCDCCDKWFDRGTGEEVKVIETTIDELFKDLENCGWHKRLE